MENVKLTDLKLKDFKIEFEEHYLDTFGTKSVFQHRLCAELLIIGKDPDSVIFETVYVIKTMIKCNKGLKEEMQ